MKITSTKDASNVSVIPHQFILEENGNMYFDTETGRIAMGGSTIISKETLLEYGVTVGTSAASGADFYPTSDKTIEEAIYDAIEATTYRIMFLPGTYNIQDYIKIDKKVCFHGMGDPSQTVFNCDTDVFITQSSDLTVELVNLTIKTADTLDFSDSVSDNSGRVVAVCSGSTGLSLIANNCNIENCRWGIQTGNGLIAFYDCNITDTYIDCYHWVGINAKNADKKLLIMQNNRIHKNFKLEIASSTTTFNHNQFVDDVDSSENICRELNIYSGYSIQVESNRFTKFSQIHIRGEYAPPYACSNGKQPVRMESLERGFSFKNNYAQSTSGTIQLLAFLPIVTENTFFCNVEVSQNYMPIEYLPNTGSEETSVEPWGSTTPSSSIISGNTVDENYSMTIVGPMYLYDEPYLSSHSKCLKSSIAYTSSNSGKLVFKSSDCKTFPDKLVSKVNQILSSSVTDSDYNTPRVYKFDIPEESLTDVDITDLGSVTGLKAINIDVGQNIPSITWQGTGYPIRVGDIKFNSIDDDTSTNLLCQVQDNKLVPLYYEATPQDTRVLELAKNVTNIVNTLTSEFCDDTLSARFVVPVWMAGTKYCGFQKSLLDIHIRSNSTALDFVSVDNYVADAVMLASDDSTYNVSVTVPSSLMNTTVAVNIQAAVYSCDTRVQIYNEATNAYDIESTLDTKFTLHYPIQLSLPENHNSDEPIKQVKFRILAEASLAKNEEVTQEYCLNIYCGE